MVGFVLLLFLSNAQIVDVVDMEITAYAPLDPSAIEGVCYSGNPNITASGTQVTVGRTVASGSNLPFGTLVFIEDIGFRVVEDRGGMIGNNNIDVAMETRKEAFKWGRRNKKVIIFRKEWKEYFKILPFTCSL